MRLLQIVGILISRNTRLIKERKSLMVPNIAKASLSIETQGISEFMINSFFFLTFYLFFFNIFNEQIVLHKMYERNFK